MPATPDFILSSFLRALGPEGTLLVPLFNFDFTRGIAFDIRSSPSQMGALTEAARRHPGAVRTGHPIYSFAAIGADAERFAGLVNYSGYGADSPFAILRQMDGSIGVLDLPDQHSMTFYHHVEEMLGVPYRYHKRFAGKYTGPDGWTEQRTFGLFVRDIEAGVQTHVDPMGEILWQKDLYAGCRPKDGSGLRVIRAEDVFRETADVIRSGRAENTLYRIAS